MTNEGSSYFNFIGWKFDMWIQAQKFIHSLQVMYKNWALSFNCEKQSFFTVELKNLTQKKKKTSLRFCCLVSFLSAILFVLAQFCRSCQLFLISPFCTQFRRFALNFTFLYWWNCTDHWFGIKWHVLSQSDCRNCCLYIINTIIECTGLWVMWEGRASQQAKLEPAHRLYSFFS